jgi:hypothetical protein
MLVLKPEVLLTVLLAPWRCVTRNVYGEWPANLICVECVVSMFSNATESQRQSKSKVAVQLLRQGPRRLAKIAPREPRRPSEQLSKGDRDSALARAAADRCTKMDRTSAAIGDSVTNVVAAPQSSGFSRAKENNCSQASPPPLSRFWGHAAAPSPLLCSGFQCSICKTDSGFQEQRKVRAYLVGNGSSCSWEFAIALSAGFSCPEL